MSDSQSWLIRKETHREWHAQTKWFTTSSKRVENSLLNGKSKDLAKKDYAVRKIWTCKIFYAFWFLLCALCTFRKVSNSCFALVMLVLSNFHHVANHRPKSEQLADAQYNWACGSKTARKKTSSRKMNTEVSTGSGKSEKKYYSRYAMRGIWKCKKVSPVTMTHLIRKDLERMK